MVWYSHLFKNFPQFVAITFKIHWRAKQGKSECGPKRMERRESERGEACICAALSRQTLLIQSCGTEFENLSREYKN